MSEAAQLPARRVLSALTMLQVQGAVEERPGRRFYALVELVEERPGKRFFAKVILTE